MTAELEEQEAQSDKIVEEKVPEDEKIQSDESPQNGGGNDLKEQEEVETQPSGGQEEVVVAAVAPRRRIPRFLQRLVQRGRHQNAGKQDTEAGTELLSKDGKVEIKEEDGKHEKNDSGTDVTVAITDDQDVTGDAGDVSRGKGKGQGDTSGGQSYWRRVAIGLAVIILVLVVISVISIMTSPGSSQRGPMVAPLVITDCGPLKGFIENNVYIFRGIPYALPPTGERRWKPPMTASNLNECWTGTYEAYNASAYCFQKLTSGLNLEMNEDCLYLDVITPSLSALALRPVVVYIPGDLPLQGYSSADIEWRPSSTLVDEKDVIFVTINYRTNIFGFLAVDILTNSVRPPTSGNYGLMDMLAALKWVQRNIRSFGGDPEKVTVLANGGGATAGLALLSSKKGHALFSQMWLTGPSAHFSNETLEKIGGDNSVFLRKLNCESDTLECLYNKTSEEILDATPNFWALDLSTDLPSIDEEPSPVMVVIDGNVLYDTPFNMWNQGDINQVPVVIGATAQESGSSKILPDLDSWNWTDFSDYVSEKLGTINSNMTASALQFYSKNSSSPHEQFHSMVSDIRVICPLENLTEVLDGVLEKDVYWYVVDYKPSSAIQFSNDTASVHMSVHGLDIAAIFGILDHYITPMTPADERFQKSMQDLFFSFVRKGIPEITQEYLLASNFINLIGDQVRSRMTPYENCQVWRNAELYPKYAKMN